MNPLYNMLDQLNGISRTILAEMGKEDPSLDELQKELDRRQEFVNELGELTKVYPPLSLSTNDRVSIKTLFETFVQLNKKIQTDMHSMLERQQGKLATAVKQRKAESGYQILKNPDNSYF